MTIIQAIREYISACPLLKNGIILEIDKLEADISYTIDTTPCSPILQNYTDGSSKRQFQFVFASREKYREHVSENLENSGFYEVFSDWLEQNNWCGVFPDLGKYRTPFKMEEVEITTTDNFQTVSLAETSENSVAYTNITGEDAESWSN